MKKDKVIEESTITKETYVSEERITPETLHEKYKRQVIIDRKKRKVRTTLAILGSVLALGAGIGVGYGIYLSAAFGPVVTDQQADNTRFVDELETSDLLSRKTDGTVEDVSNEFINKPTNYDTATTNLYVKDTNASNGIGSLKTAATEGYLYVKADTIKNEDLYEVKDADATGARLEKTNVNKNYITKPTGTDRDFDGANSSFLWAKGTDETNGKSTLNNASDSYLYTLSSDTTIGNLYETQAKGANGSRLGTTNVNAKYIVKPTGTDRDFDNANSTFLWVKGTDTNGKSTLDNASDSYLYTMSSDTTIGNLYETQAKGANGSRLGTDNVNAKYITKPTGTDRDFDNANSTFLWVKGTDTNGKSTLDNASDSYLYTMSSDTTIGNLYETQAKGANGSRLGTDNVNAKYITKPTGTDRDFDNANSTFLWVKGTDTNGKSTLDNASDSYLYTMSSDTTIGNLYETQAKGANGSRLGTDNVNAKYITKPTGTDRDFDNANSTFLWVKGTDTNGKSTLDNASDSYLYTMSSDTGLGNLYETQAKGANGSRLGTDNVNAKYIVKPGDFDPEFDAAGNVSDNNLNLWVRNGYDPGGKGNLINASSSYLYVKAEVNDPNTPENEVTVVGDLYQVTTPTNSGASLTPTKVNKDYVTKPTDFDTSDNATALWLKNGGDVATKGSLTPASATYLYVANTDTDTVGDIYQVTAPTASGASLTPTKVNKDYIVKPKSTVVGDGKDFDGDNKTYLWVKGTDVNGKSTLKNANTEGYLYIKQPKTGGLVPQDGELFVFNANANTRNGSRLFPTQTNDYIKASLLKHYFQLPIAANIPNRTIDAGPNGEGSTTGRSVYSFNITNVNPGDQSIRSINFGDFRLYDAPNKKGLDALSDAVDAGNSANASFKNFYFVGKAGEILVAFMFEVSISSSRQFAVRTPIRYAHVFLHGNTSDLSTFSFQDVHDRTSAATVYDPNNISPNTDYRLDVQEITSARKLPFTYFRTDTIITRG